MSHWPTLSRTSERLRWLTSPRALLKQSTCSVVRFGNVLCRIVDISGTETSGSEMSGKDGRVMPPGRVMSGNDGAVSSLGRVSPPDSLPDVVPAASDTVPPTDEAVVEMVATELSSSSPQATRPSAATEVTRTARDRFTGAPWVDQGPTTVCPS